METSEEEGMGKSDIKYGDTIVFIQHSDTGLWLSYQTTEVKKKGVGKVEEKKVCIGHLIYQINVFRLQKHKLTHFDKHYICRKKRLDEHCTCRKYFGGSWIYEQTPKIFKG